MLDRTTLWAFWQSHKQYIVQVLIGILLFGAGWQIGRAMSPYYAAHPIIFQEGGGVVSQPADLKAITAPSPQPTVAGVAGVGQGYSLALSTLINFTTPAVHRLLGSRQKIRSGLRPSKKRNNRATHLANAPQNC